MFLSTLTIIQYDLVLGFYCHFKNSNPRIFNNNCFIGNDLVYDDLSKLIREISCRSPWPLGRYYF